MKIITRASSAITAAVLAASLAACTDGQYYAPYVVGTYTCASPLTGQPDYCVEYSDGTSALVPFSIYSTVYYGSVLTYSGSRYSYTRPAVLRRAPDVYHVVYHAHSFTTNSSRGSYQGMSYVNKGRVIYRAPGSSYHSTFRSSYSGRS
jgi:hypothetical protein